LGEIKTGIISRQTFWGYIIIILSGIQYSFLYTNIEIPAYGILDKIFFMIYFFVFALFLLENRYTYSIFKKIVLLFLCSLLLGSYSFTQLIIFAIICAHLSYKNIFRTLGIIRFLAFLLVMLFALLNIFDIHQIEIYKAGQIVVGNGLGYSHPNRCAMVIAFLIILYIGWKNKQFRIVDGIFCVAISAVGYWLTKSRTLVVIVFFAIVFNLGIHSKLFVNFWKKTISTISLVVMPACAFFSCYMAIAIGTGGKFGRIADSLNVLFSLRFTHINRVFRYYPLTIFGGITNFSVIEDMFGYGTIDNGYIFLIYRFGIAGFLAFIILSTLAIIQLNKKKEYTYIIIYIITSIWAVSENILVNFAFNLVVVFWGELIVTQKRLLIKLRK